MSPNPNVEIFAKLEGTNPSGSIKDRIALKMITQAENEGALTKEKTIVNIAELVGRKIFVRVFRHSSFAFADCAVGALRGIGKSNPFFSEHNNKGWILCITTFCKRSEKRRWFN